MNLKSSKTKNFHQIVIDESNYDALKQLGRTGESFNDVLTKLLADYNSSLISIGTILADRNNVEESNNE